MENLTVLIIGSGAREHAISHAYEKSPQVKRIIVAPGNDFMKYKRDKEVFTDICSLKDAQSILEIAQRYKPDLVDVAQDDALSCGAVDLLQQHGYRVFGPSQKASRIEWDKEWSREFMKRQGIPTPDFKVFRDHGVAKEYVCKLYAQDPEILIFTKATGLCAGKGALPSGSLEEALRNIGSMDSFGDAGKKFIIEEGVAGEEFSLYAISDGKNYKILKSAQDNKRVFDLDKGDQTGGMGATCPAMITSEISDKIETMQIRKAIGGMAQENNPYVGILYLGGIFGLSLNTIEYNARWGDPECQVVLPSITTDYVDIVNACIDGTLDKLEIAQDGFTRVYVVGTIKGYPGIYEKGKEIFGLKDAMKHATVLGAGIQVRKGRFYSNGGRLFSVIGKGKNIKEARESAYEAISRISIDGNNLHYRTDIGSRDLSRFELTSSTP